MRRLIIVGIVFGIGVCVQTPVVAQRQFNRITRMDPNRVTSAIDRSIKQAMDDAQALIKESQFADAVRLLQAVIDFPEDFFNVKDFRTRDDSLPIKGRTNRILAGLSAEGRAAYELEYGAAARALLNDAVQSSDVEKFEQVVSRFRNTSAGFDAMQWLVINAFDHDRPLDAALLCEAMTEHFRASGELREALLLRSAYAWYLAGQPERAQAALKALDKLDSRAAWRIGGKQIAAGAKETEGENRLASLFGIPNQKPIPSVTEWFLPRGGVTANEAAPEAYPVGGGEWTASPLKHVRIEFDPVENRKLVRTIDRIAENHVRMLREDDRAAVPSMVPLITGNTLVYRTVNDVTALDLKSGALRWRSAISDGMLAWMREHGAADSESTTGYSPLTLPGYIKYKLFRDQLSGSLSTDGRYVYSVEEVDTQFSMFRSAPRQRMGEPIIVGPVNRLTAYELDGGRLAWQVGGMRGTPPQDLSGIFFLGPPVPYAGHLYCLAEVRDELRLLALTLEGDSVRLEWSQSLVLLYDGLSPAPPRRQAGLIPAIYGNTIVCPTSTGAVVAYDLQQHQLRWGNQYEARRGRMNSGFEVSVPLYPDDESHRWFDGNPLISSGRVVITPRDSDEIYCLDLVDGHVYWHRARDRGMYVGCVNGDAVVVIGKSQAVALSLLNGGEMWSSPWESGEPSGRGIRIGSRYLVPLSSGDIATVDLTAGRILGRTKLADGKVPGNLAIGADGFVSLGFHDLLGFRTMADVETQIAGRTRTNPYDPLALALRGELRLHNGELDAAISDLRASLAQKPDRHVKRVLAGVLLSILEKNPAELLKAAPELEQLTDDPQQRIEFLRQYVRALTGSGDRVTGVRQLFRLATASELTDDMLAVSGGHSITTRQNIRSELRKIYGEASASERRDIEATFESELENLVKMRSSLPRLKQFIHLISGHPAAESVIRKLVELDTVKENPAFRSQLLEKLADSSVPSYAAFAIGTLANRALEQRSRDATIWVDELGQKHVSEISIEGKTGKQLFDEWSVRKDVKAARSLPFAWPQGQFDVQRSRKRPDPYGYPIELVSRVGHFFEGWSFLLDPESAHLIARDPSTRVAWKLEIKELSDIPWGLPAQLHIRDRYLCLQSGPWLIAMESDDSFSEPRVLFMKSLRSSQPTERFSQDNAQNRRMLPSGRRFQSSIDYRASLGMLVGFSADLLFYQLDNRLNAVDLETGQLVWFRVGPEFSRSDATIDEKLVLYSSNNEATLLDPLDGTLLHKQKGNLDEKTIWFRGTRRLTERSEGLDQYRIYEMRDVSADKIIWQSQHPAGTQKCIIEQQEFVVLEPGGKLVAMNLDSGDIRLTTDVPIVRPVGGSGEFSVHRFEGLYVIVGGVAVARDQASPISPLEIGPSNDNSFTVDGFACACDRQTGRLVWSVPIERIAFNSSQPVNQPLLVLAARRDFDHLTQNTASSRLSAMILDKRNGKLIYDTQEQSPSTGRGAQIIPLVDENKLIVDFQVWNLEVGFPETDASK